MFNRTLATIAFVFLFASCTTTSPSFAPRVPCKAATFTVVDEFAGARRGRCVAIADNHVRVTILPEDDGYINPSPWFAFKVLPSVAGPAKFTLNYLGGHHRYHPKMSFDGVRWSVIDTNQVVVSTDREKVVITVNTGKDPFWIAGQELITPAIYDIWNRKIAANSVAYLDVLGESKSGRPIHRLDINGEGQDVLFLVGRQHPPEVSGSIAFFAFYETLTADTELAARFRQRFHIVAVPLLNPDGVIGGNWRHNLGSTDLNRDWGPFRQPETQLIEDLLDSFDAAGKRVRIFLDFHSTKKNVFYTQNDDNPTYPPHFTRTWLENAKPRIRSYPFTYSENPVDQIGVAKNYMYKRYGIPSSTYEVGDETDREATRNAARVFAEELMLLMLEQIQP